MTFKAPGREVDRIFIHCSASDRPEHDDISVMRDWHVNSRNWSDVGYHFFIKKDGTVQEGRPLERIPAAQAGNNAGTIAICLHGLTAERFTKAQYESLIRLCGEIDTAYGGMVTFHGHREVSTKDCPVFPYREVLGLDAHGSSSLAPTVSPLTSDTADAIPTVPRPTEPLLRLMARGQPVLHLQAMLSRAGHILEEDGIFGQNTLAAVQAFQRSQDLKADGIVGPRTWTALRAVSAA
ncbi:peptidoglycan recognition protein family protein [Nitrococcus mobilis]|uniref:N-acetylmuramoyl-L-alanine amidase, putative n=1 Tax=Nitrococcus mobilis Nb-231 TaxID=314278 RepID=A4BV20_9GAMM|nr:peptidoglycan-binding domain-containing protein [Nitrococcus mobilis]EAR20441.1 N-acetylmuramoyl-L-alanine amidase, putative [Nitrococcus mobilis Nb-231]